MRTSQIGALVIVVGIVGLVFGVAAGYGIYSGKTATTSIVQITTIRQIQATTAIESMNVTQTSTLTVTQTTTAVEKMNVTVASYCCIDPNLTISTPCSTIAAANYPPAERLQYLIETDPNFIAAENGLDYYDTTSGPGCGNTFINGSVVNGTVQGVVKSTTLYFIFAYVTDKLTMDGCGDIVNFTYYLYVNVPLTETGYNMSAIQITPTNTTEITMSCSSTVTSTENTIVTIT